MFSSFRTVRLKSKKLWESKTIPYELDLQYTALERSRILQGMRSLDGRTCIKFVRRTNQTDYIYINRNADTCSSEIGRRGGKQSLSLAPVCVGDWRGPGAVIHELMHALGFIHEQSRYDRDSWIEIDFDNIWGGEGNKNLRKYSHMELDTLKTSYDYASIMHYPEYIPFFVKDPSKPIFRPLKITKGVKIGQTFRLSATDITSVRKLYC